MIGRACLAIGVLILLIGVAGLIHALLAEYRFRRGMKRVTTVSGCIFIECPYGCEGSCVNPRL